MKIGQKSKKYKCPYCHKPLRYRGKDTDGKQVFSCKRPYRFVKGGYEPPTLVEQVFKRRDDGIKVGYCDYKLRV